MAYTTRSSPQAASLKANKHILFPTGIFVPSIGLEDIIAHKETLTKFAQQALNDSCYLTCLNSEMPPMRKAVPHNRMALCVITAWKGYLRH